MNFTKAVASVTLFFAFPALAADWTLVVQTVHGDAHYIDVSSVKRAGDTATIWVRSDFAVRFKNGSKSAKVQKVYQCTRSEVRHVYALEYRGDNGSGEVVTSFRFPDQSWSPIAPDTVEELLFRAACR